MKKIVFLSLMMAFTTLLAAQVSINEEPIITEVMQKYISHNLQNPTLRAWKIQILTTNDRREMEDGIKKFETLYPDLEYAWEHNPPYYQVRIGAYELREDLEATLLLLKNHFPSSLPVQSEMEKSELLKF